MDENPLRIDHDNPGAEFSAAVCRNCPCRPDAFYVSASVEDGKTAWVSLTSSLPFCKSRCRIVSSGPAAWMAAVFGFGGLRVGGMCFMSSDSRHLERMISHAENGGRVWVDSCPYLAEHAIMSCNQGMAVFPASTPTKEQRTRWKTIK